MMLARTSARPLAAESHPGMAPDATVFIDPGDEHANAPCSLPQIAQRLAVTEVDVCGWLADGCPQESDGRLDPFQVCNWLSWGQLGRCPVLARRWNSWLRWFTTTGKPCRVVVARSQTCRLPEPRPLRWLVPEPGDAPGQQVVARQWNEGEALAGFRCLDRPTAREHRWSAEDELALRPEAAEPRNRQEFETLLTNLAGAFTYAYRRHRPGEVAGPIGTCLDIARLLGVELERVGRRWRLVSGVVAHRGLANLHFWVEADDGPAGWIPLDPTIPAVARMLGRDWRRTVSLAVGRHDARRIRLACSEGPIGDDLAGITGWLDAGGASALYCTDWATGECSWSIAAA